jgi:hypothetical protein
MVTLVQARGCLAYLGENDVMRSARTLESRCIPDLVASRRMIGLLPRATLRNGRRWTDETSAGGTHIDGILGICGSAQDQSARVDRTSANEPRGGHLKIITQAGNHD